MEFKWPENLFCESVCVCMCAWIPHTHKQQLCNSYFCHFFVFASARLTALTWVGFGYKI